MEAMPASVEGRGPTLAEDPALGLSHRQKLEILGAVLLALFLGALDQTIVGTALPQIVTDLNGNELYTWVVTIYLLTSTITVPVLRQAVRPVRPQAAPDVRDHRLPDRLRPVRPEPDDGAADHLPRPAGPRRRRAVPDLAGRHRRPVQPGRARPLPGPVRRRVRAIVHPRPGHRRPAHRLRQLALGLLRQHPDRHRQPGRDLAAAAHRSPAGRRAQHRLPRRRRLRGRDLVPARRADQQVGPDVGRDPERVDRLHRRRLPPDRARPVSDLRGHRVAREGADRPAQPVARPDLCVVDHLDVPDQLRVLRRDHLPAALVPGRSRRERDALGLPALPAADRPHRQLDHLRESSCRGPAATRCSCCRASRSWPSASY